ncbi:MAG: hypothetical protein WC959_08060 [Kiritimatiellales bacterium]
MITKTGAHSGSTYYEYVEFYKAVCSNIQPPVTAYDGFLTVAVGAAVEESVRTGIPVYMEDILARVRQ